MSLINCKVELNIQWTNHCVLSANGSGNTPDNINFAIKDTNLYIPAVTLSARSANWNECKTKTENKNLTDKYRLFLVSNFIGDNILFVLIYSNQDGNAKRFTT